MSKPNELNLSAIWQFLWGARFFVAIGTALCVAGAAVYAFLAPSVYYAHSIVTPKEQQSGGGNLFSQLGGAASLMSSSLGMGTNVLDRLEVLAHSRGLSEQLVGEYHLLPLIFPKWWDKAAGTWKKGITPPTDADGADELLFYWLKVSVNFQKKLLVIGVEAPSDTLSKSMVERYLASLNKRIRDDAQKESDANRGYLEAQMASVPDPLVREKIQNMIATEIEKSMLVSSKAFDVLEKPYVPATRLKPQRMKILLMSVVAGVALSLSCFYMREKLAGPRPEGKAA